MNAIKQVRNFLLEHPHTPSANGLACLTEALAQEREFPLATLYELDGEAFDLAIELMRDWRLDRYYAARIRLFDTVLLASKRDSGRAEGISEVETAEESVA